MSTSHPTIEQLGINREFFKYKPSLGEGKDSGVWGVALNPNKPDEYRYVVHRYYAGFDRMPDYYQATQDAVRFLKNRKQYQAFGFTFAVSPILQVGEIDGRVVSLLEYVPYTRLYDMRSVPRLMADALNTFCSDFMNHCGWEGIDPGFINTRIKKPNRLLGLLNLERPRLHITDLCSVITYLKKRT